MPLTSLCFFVIKQCAPGNADEQIAVNANILNPHCCSNAKAAQIELLKWKENVRRLAELNKAPPDILLCYRGMESIFSAVFDKADQMLQQKWITLKIRLDLPHNVTMQAMAEVSAFADAELGAMILQGHSQLNPGLPLTENQEEPAAPDKRWRQETSRSAQGEGDSHATGASTSTSSSSCECETSRSLSYYLYVEGTVQGLESYRNLFPWHLM